MAAPTLDRPADEPPDATYEIPSSSVDDDPGERHRLGVVGGLAALSLDALASVAYGPEAIVLVLALAGGAGLGLTVPVTIVIAVLLVVLTLSHRQVIAAFPQGGGAYGVARAHLGRRPGLLAAASLIVDDVLNVAVSVAAGVAALGAARSIATDDRAVHVCDPGRTRALVGAGPAEPTRRRAGPRGAAPPGHRGLPVAVPRLTAVPDPTRPPRNRGRCGARSVDVGSRRVTSVVLAAAAVVAAVTLAACAGGSGGSGGAVPSASSTAATAVDVTFLSQMLPHHERAIEIAQLATTRAQDPAVQDFARRIVREQTPELDRMTMLAKTVALDTTAGAEMADHRVSDDELAQLQAATGPAFDRMFLTLSIASEQGAVAMSQPEIADGRVPDAVALANAINSAPTGEILQLQQLLDSLPPP